ncbi:hypothetical protein F442_20945 [Phytophthora nicotianae P10297]|uniref:Uncharacterized protein n=1 Tax=Phytophthora nicotianae P10297 TaxID=1317064 RepID=W2Y713_PHYNI|nr:hypothetical protein F442_20945 [Phytophthora nicotianae P10297]
MASLLNDRQFEQEQTEGRSLQTYRFPMPKQGGDHERPVETCHKPTQRVAVADVMCETSYRSPARSNAGYRGQLARTIHAQDAHSSTASVPASESSCGAQVAKSRQRQRTSSSVSRTTTSRATTRERDEVSEPSSRSFTNNNSNGLADSKRTGASRRGRTMADAVISEIEDQKRARQASAAENYS